jgi:hypothetical protein
MVPHDNLLLLRNKSVTTRVLRNVGVSCGSAPGTTWTRLLCWHNHINRATALTHTSSVDAAMDSPESQQVRLCLRVIPFAMPLLAFSSLRFLPARVVLASHFCLLAFSSPRSLCARDVCMVCWPRYAMTVCPICRHFFHSTSHNTTLCSRRMRRAAERSPDEN